MQDMEGCFVRGKDALLLLTTQLTEMGTTDSTDVDGGNMNDGGNERGWVSMVCMPSPYFPHPHFPLPLFLPLFPFCKQCTHTWTDAVGVVCHGLVAAVQKTPLSHRGMAALDLWKKEITTTVVVITRSEHNSNSCRDLTLSCGSRDLKDMGSGHPRITTRFLLLIRLSCAVSPPLKVGECSTRKRRIQRRGTLIILASLGGLEDARNFRRRRWGSIPSFLLSA